MYTAQQIFDMAMDFMDKRSVTGVIDQTKTKRYQVRTPSILTAWQNEISKNGDLYSTYEISNKPATNLFGYTNGMDYIRYEGKEFTKEVLGSAKYYYLESDGEGTIYIEDFNGSWNTLATINVPSSVTSFTAYKGIVTPSSGATKSRIRLTGSYSYLITNYAMFDIPVNPNKMFDFRPWIEKQMPDDFKSVDQIINEYPDRQYSKDTTFKWEGKRDLYVNYFYEGNIRIVYKPVPIKITALTQTLQVDDITATNGAYYLAAHLLLVEDPASASFFNERFMELKIEGQKKAPVVIDSIVDVYEGW